MSRKKYYITLILWMLCLCTMHSREVRTEICVNFRVNSVAVDTDYLDNASRIQEIISYLQSIRQNPDVELLEVRFCGAASPEGSYQLNSRLARERLFALESLVRSQIDIPDELVMYDDSYIPWDYLKEQVERSDLRYKDIVLRILDEDPLLVPHHYPNLHVDQRVLQLKQLDRGSVWLELYQLYFAHMRNAYVVFVTNEAEDYAQDNDRDVAQERHYRLPELPSLRTVKNSSWGHNIHLKTNVLAWASGMVNLAPEIDVAAHWSVALPVCYSAWDYFKSTVKMRCLLFQPEVRYWVDAYNTGFFAGVHLGVSSYNFAFDGEYRFQDHEGVTPAFGGGVSLGYRIPISRSGNWQMEFSLGAGAYRLHFDVFNNTPDVKDGTLVSTERMTYVGLDNASVSFLYSFNLRKKGGGR